MVRQFLEESLIFFAGTVFFLVLCATVGISTSTPPTSPTAEAAPDPECVAEDPGLDRYPTRKLEEVKTSPGAEHLPYGIQPTYRRSRSTKPSSSNLILSDSD
jgi:hypothetical protein